MRLDNPRGKIELKFNLCRYLFNPLKESIVRQVVECVVKMANPKHVAVVRKGAAAIKEWRRMNPRKVLQLDTADLSKIDLAGADLSDSDLFRADLSGANLMKANLSTAYLFLADLESADLSQANLSNALISDANLRSAKLSRANLFGAILTLANFTVADLSEASLINSSLYVTSFLNTKFDRTNFTDARMHGTVMCNCDLGTCVGLETVRHDGPSYIDYVTLVNSFRDAGNRFTPEMETFFANAGMPKQLLDELPMILAEVKYCACFICYGHPDVKFAKRLEKDLKSRGVSCWLYEMHSTPGKRTWEEITMKRREAEKMIILCSVKVLMRDGVKKEIEEQIDEGRDKIVPVSLDYDWKHEGFEVKRGQRDLKPSLLERNYADFCDESKYDESLNRLLTGIKRT
ncbi:MAG: toll/interleukin-1 receptor domain-containing protein [Candidatus Bathyarchaeota archaeon]|nr:toll/interleukin-1 receptor domain-containing protein [Candidatus Bathyarchaeota archaeon]